MQLYHPKTTAGALGGALSVIFVMELSRHGVPIDAAEGGAITLLLGWLCGYIAPDSDVTQADVEAGIKPPPMQMPVRTVRADTPAGPTVQALLDELDIPPRPKPPSDVGPFGPMDRQPIQPAPVRTPPPVTTSTTPMDSLSSALLRPGASGRIAP